MHGCARGPPPEGRWGGRSNPPLVGCVWGRVRWGERREVRELCVCGERWGERREVLHVILFRGGGGGGGFKIFWKSAMQLVAI